MEISERREREMKKEDTLTAEDIDQYFKLRSKLPSIRGKEYVETRLKVEELRKKVMFFFGFDLDRK